MIDAKKLQTKFINKYRNIYVKNHKQNETHITHSYTHHIAYTDTHTQIYLVIEINLESKVKDFIYIRL